MRQVAGAAGLWIAGVLAMLIDFASPTAPQCFAQDPAGGIESRLSMRLHWVQFAVMNGRINARTSHQPAAAQMEQAGRIYSQNLLTLGLSVLSVKYPRTSFFLLQPPRTSTLLFGPSMGFEASRKALRFGYESTMEWLDEQGAPLLRRLAIAIA